MAETALDRWKQKFRAEVGADAGLPMDESDFLRHLAAHRQLGADGKKDLVESVHWPRNSGSGSPRPMSARPSMRTGYGFDESTSKQFKSGRPTSARAASSHTGKGPKLHRVGFSAVRHKSRIRPSTAATARTAGGNTVLTIGRRVLVGGNDQTGNAPFHDSGASSSPRSSARGSSRAGPPALTVGSAATGDNDALVTPTVANEGQIWSHHGDRDPAGRASPSPVTRVDLAGHVQLGPRTRQTDALGIGGIPAWGRTQGQQMQPVSTNLTRPQSARARRTPAAAAEGAPSGLGGIASTPIRRPSTARGGRDKDPESEFIGSSKARPSTAGTRRPRPPPSSTTAAAAVRMAGRPLGSRPRYLREAEIPGGTFSRRRDRSERPWTAGPRGGAGVGSRGQGLGPAWAFESGEQARQL